MRPRFIALVSLSVLTACASNEYSSVPEPTGEWVAVNPSGFQPLPLTSLVRPVVRRAYYRRAGRPPVHTAKTAEVKP